MANTSEEPIVDGVPIPKGNFEIQTEIELDLGKCTVRQLQGILGEFSFCLKPNFLVKLFAQKLTVQFRHSRQTLDDINLESDLTIYFSLDFLLLR